MKPFDVYPQYDIQLIKAKGCFVWDNKGDKYLDFYGGHAVISIGHSHPLYVGRIQDQLQKIGFYSNAIKNRLQVELAEELGRQSGYKDYQLFLCNSGAEANENALKLASFHTKKKKVIAFQNGFHGRTSLAVGVTDNPSIKAAINEHEVEFLPLNNISSVEEKLSKNDIGAIIIEGIQGIAGVISPEHDFMNQLRFLCTELDVPLIIDEVQSGYGRSGKFYAHQYYNIKADIVTVAKGMGNGFPIGAVLIHPRYKTKYGMLGSTFGGNHLACAAGKAVLDVLKEDDLVVNASKVGRYLIKELKQIKSIKEVRGRGLMIGIELYEPAKAVREKLLFDKHIFTGSSSQLSTIRLLPPLCLNQEEADLFLIKLKEVMN